MACRRRPDSPSANGSEIAREERDTIEDDMTATQIARVTELARTCMDSDYENCEG